jgi:hypothetical protein
MIIPHPNPHPARLSLERAGPVKAIRPGFNKEALVAVRVPAFPVAQQILVREWLAVGVWRQRGQGHFPVDISGAQYQTDFHRPAPRGSHSPGACGGQLISNALENHFP